MPDRATFDCERLSKKREVGVRIRPSINLMALPASLPLAERFAVAREAGFEGIEVELRSAPVAALKEAAERTGIVIHSVHCRDNYLLPLTSGDRSIAAAGAASVVRGIRMAAALGADTVLLTPGIVGPDASYAEVYDRSCEVIRRDLLPVAEYLGIVIGIENVWNGVLLSPIEYARYVDGFGSPWVRAYLDIGNMFFGHPEGWIEVLGARIIKLHFKDHRVRLEKGRRPVRLGEGDIDWARVFEALERIGFSGWGLVAEIDEALPLFPRVYKRVTRWQPPVAVAAAAVGAAQAILVRSVLRDVMRRFRQLDCRAAESRTADAALLSQANPA